MPSPQYNPRRQHREPPKKVKRSGASSTRGEAARVTVPWWLWIIAGTALGIFVSFLTRLAQTAPPPPAAVAAPKIPQKTTADKPVAADAANNAKVADTSDAKPDETKTVTKFDFYTLLPEREVIVPNDREAIKAAEKAKAAAGTQTAVTETELLLLQTGSFRSEQEAERRRTRVKALGLDAKVEQVTANADTWYRVQTGPFTSREQLSKARDELRAAGIESLLLRQTQ